MRHARAASLDSVSRPCVTESTSHTRGLQQKREAKRNQLKQALQAASDLIPFGRVSDHAVPDQFVQNAHVTPPV